MSCGVFVIIGWFSFGVCEFVDSVVMRLVFIDGVILVCYMVWYGVGVLVRESFEFKQFDEEFFED